PLGHYENDENRQDELPYLRRKVHHGVSPGESSRRCSPTAAATAIADASILRENEVSNKYHNPFRVGVESAARGWPPPSGAESAMRGRCPVCRAGSESVRVRARARMSRRSTQRGRPAEVLPLGQAFRLRRHSREWFRPG